MKTLIIFSFVRELTKSLLTPIPIFWLILIVGLVFFLAGKKRIARSFLWLSLLWFFLISTPFLPQTLLSNLENQYHPIQLTLEKENQHRVQDSIVNIMVLGSGYSGDNQLSFCSKLDLSGLARLVEGIRLHRLLPGSKLIFSGYAGSHPLPLAVVSELAAQELGIDSVVICTLCEPWNTKTEAEEYFKRFGTANKLYLITDAAHMPRAVMHFHNAGLKPIPAPTNFIIRKNNSSGSYKDYFPSTSNIHSMEIVFQEYLGMLWAKMGGN